MTKNLKKHDNLKAKIKLTTSVKKSKIGSEKIKPPLT